MKKILLIVLLGIVIANANAQIKANKVIVKPPIAKEIIQLKAPNNPVDGLEKIIMKLWSETGNGNEIILYISYGNKKYKPKTAKYFANLINNSSTDSLKVFRNNSRQFIADNKSIIVSYLNNISGFGDSDANMYGFELPIDFINFNGKLAFYQGGVLYENKLNTIKLDANERAKRVVTDLILPSLKNFEPLLKTNFEYFILSANYLCKDFTNEDMFDKTEMVSIVIPKQMLIHWRYYSQKEH